MTRKIEKNVHVRETACFLITLFITLLYLLYLYRRLEDCNHSN